MPARSNDFQRLVFLVKRVLADSATITESKILPDSRTGTQREVDVCLEAIVGGHPVVVSIECRDHGRRADVAWVEQMKAKHEHLATNTLVLASRSGFSQEARTVADAEGIQILGYKNVSEQKVQNTLGSTGSVWGTTYELTITKVVAVLGSVGDTPGERVLLSPDSLISTAKRQWSAQELVHSLITDGRVAERFIEEGEETSRFFSVGMMGLPLLQLEGSPAFLENLDPRALTPLKEFRVRGTCRIATGQFKMRSALLGGTKIMWGTSVLDGRRAMLLFLSPDVVTFDLEAKADATD